METIDQKILSALAEKKEEISWKEIIERVPGDHPLIWTRLEALVEEGKVEKVDLGLRDEPWWFQITHLGTLDLPKEKAGQPEAGDNRTQEITAIPIEPNSIPFEADSIPSEPIEEHELAKETVIEEPQTPISASPQAEDGHVDIINKGWIKLYRKILENPIMKDSEAFHLLGYFLLKANHKANRFLFNQREMVVERGQLITGRAKISKDTGLTPRQIRTRLALLKNLEILTIKTTNRFSLITVCNYDLYQGGQEDERPAERPANDQQTTTNKNYKNIKIYVEGSDELRLSTFLLEEIRKNKPDFKQPNLQAWAKEVGLMLRRDGRKPEQIEAVIKWVQADHGDGTGRWKGWAPNILSPGKLKAKFDELEIKMDSSQKVGGFKKSSW